MAAHNHHDATGTRRTVAAKDVTLAGEHGRRLGVQIGMVAAGQLSVDDVPELSRTPHGLRVNVTKETQDVLRGRAWVGEQ